MLLNSFNKRNNKYHEWYHPQEVLFYHLRSLHQGYGGVVLSNS